ncbi:STM4504/CBY_0614 family protein [Aeromonas dhakensis]
MAIHDIYSKRQKRLRGEFSDVYQYDFIPQKPRVQICKIYNSFFSYNPQLMNLSFEAVYEILTTEYGVDNLNCDYHDIEIHCNKSEESQRLISFAKRYAETDCFLDVLELLLTFISEQKELGSYSGLDLSEVVEEINIRFRENSVGYQFDLDSLTIIRVDSQFIHSEVVKPVLTLLNADPAYAGALDEFMLAHEHYRHQNFKDAILNCGKSFESMLKAIHEKRGWAYDKHKDTANKLILSCVEKGLFPSFQQDQLMQVRKILECGVPTIRNKTAGHGQGHEVIEVPEHLVSYMIHLTATNLLFLSCSEQIST